MSYSTYVLEPKTIRVSLTRRDRKSKDLAHLLKAVGKFVIPNLYPHLVSVQPSHSWFRSGTNWLKWCEDRFMNLLPQALSELVLAVDEFYSGTGRWFPIVYISRCCIGWNRRKYDGDNNQRKRFCVVAPPIPYFRYKRSLILHAWFPLLHVMLSSVPAGHSIYPFKLHHVLHTCFQTSTKVSNHLNHVQVQIL